MKNILDRLKSGILDRAPVKQIKQWCGFGGIPLDQESSLGVDYSGLYSSMLVGEGALQATRGGVIRQTHKMQMDWSRAGGSPPSLFEEKPDFHPVRTP